MVDNEWLKLWDDLGKKVNVENIDGSGIKTEGLPIKSVKILKTTGSISSDGKYSVKKYYPTSDPKIMIIIDTWLKTYSYTNGSYTYYTAIPAFKIIKYNAETNILTTLYNSNTSIILGGQYNSTNGNNDFAGMYVNWLTKIHDPGYQPGGNICVTKDYVFFNAFNGGHLDDSNYYNIWSGYKCNTYKLNISTGAITTVAVSNFTWGNDYYENNVTSASSDCGFIPAGLDSNDIYVFNIYGNNYYKSSSTNAILRLFGFLYNANINPTSGTVFYKYSLDSGTFTSFVYPSDLQNPGYFYPILNMKNKILGCFMQSGNNGNKPAKFYVFNKNDGTWTTEDNPFMSIYNRSSSSIPSVDNPSTVVGEKRKCFNHPPYIGSLTYDDAGTYGMSPSNYINNYFIPFSGVNIFKKTIFWNPVTDELYSYRSDRYIYDKKTPFNTWSMINNSSGYETPTLKDWFLKRIDPESKYMENEEDELYRLPFDEYGIKNIGNTAWTSSSGTSYVNMNGYTACLNKMIYKVSNSYPYVRKTAMKEYADPVNGCILSDGKTFCLSVILPTDYFGNRMTSRTTPTSMIFAFELDDSMKGEIYSPLGVK